MGRSPDSFRIGRARERHEVNPDCSGATHFEPGPGITLEERLVIVDDGDEIRTIVSLPTAVMVSTVQKKMNTR